MTTKTMVPMSLPDVGRAVADTTQEFLAGVSKVEGALQAYLGHKNNKHTVRYTAIVMTAQALIRACTHNVAVPFLPSYLPGCRGRHWPA
jgi:hypothetical protein